MLLIGWIDTGRLNGWTDSAYHDLVDPGCQLLLGPRFSLLSDDYGKARERVSERNQISTCSHFFGGVDYSNWCSAALKALSHPQLEGLQVDVVLAERSTSSE